MSSWKTVPNFFPDYDDLSNETKYHLNEGFGVSEYVTKRSGRYYKKVKMMYQRSDNFYSLIRYLDYDKWWERWKPNTSWWGRFWGSWEKIKPV